MQRREQIQIIERDRKPEWAILPDEDYLQQIEQAELLEDIPGFDAISVAIERGDEDLSAIAKVLDVSLEQIA